MSDEAVVSMIGDYLKEIRRQMPDTFETDDLLDDLKVHIFESLENKVVQYPDEDKIKLIQDVLDNLGDPTTIAEEYNKSAAPDGEPEKSQGNAIRFIIQYWFVGIVVVAAAWFVSSLENSIVDFWTALIILLIFVTAEGVLRAWQKSETSLIDAST